MAKKSSKINLIYLIGMVIAAIGFCVPMFYWGKTPFNKELILRHPISDKIMNGFYFIDFEKFSNYLKDGKIAWITFAAMLLLCGIVMGIIFAFVKIKPASILRLVALLIMVTAVFIILWQANNGRFTKWIGEKLWERAYVGTYMVIGGWVAGLVGWIVGK